MILPEHSNEIIQTIEVLLAGGLLTTLVMAALNYVSHTIGDRHLESFKTASPDNFNLE